jgi:hypothetical protein
VKAVGQPQLLAVREYHQRRKVSALAYRRCVLGHNGLVDARSGLRSAIGTDVAQIERLGV